MLTLPNRKSEASAAALLERDQRHGRPRPCRCPYNGRPRSAVQPYWLLFAAGFGLVQPRQERIVGGEMLVIVDPAPAVPADCRWRWPAVGGGAAFGRSGGCLM